MTMLRSRSSSQRSSTSSASILTKSNDVAGGKALFVSAARARRDGSSRSSVGIGGRDDREPTAREGTLGWGPSSWRVGAKWVTCRQNTWDGRGRIVLETGEMRRSKHGISVPPIWLYQAIPIASSPTSGLPANLSFCSPNLVNNNAGPSWRTDGRRTGTGSISVD